MSRSIIQTEVTKKMSGLELDSRRPSMSGRCEAIVEELTNRSQLGPPCGDSRLWDEITYLFRMI